MVAARDERELIDGSIVGEGTVVIDVDGTRIEGDTERGHELVGDVNFERLPERVARDTGPRGGGESGR